VIESEFARQSYIYKRAGRARIGADVYPATSGKDGPKPAVLFFHGGALVMGTRRWLRPHLVQRLTGEGYVVVSCDYRLAPETPLAGIAEDIEHAYAWVREWGSNNFGVDERCIAVMGGSAGGYLTLLAGVRFRPRPRALVSFYGYGDISGAWYTEPSPYYCQMPPVSEEQARALLHPATISRSGGERFPLYLRLRQQGSWPRIVSGHDPVTEPDCLRAFCPVANVAPRYPPTLLLHGDADTDVPWEQSRLMAEALALAGIEHRLITIAGGEHGFDRRDSDPEVRRAIDAVLAFLAAHFS
jgi:acetyl esterase/lipase